MSVRKSAKTSHPAQLYKMSQNHSFCLYSHFSQTREIRLKSSRQHFCTLLQKEALKKQKHRNYLIHRRKILTIHRALFAPKCRFAKYALQNTYFSPVFAHILAWCFYEFNVVKIQTSRATIAISACCVAKLRLRRCQTRRFKTNLAPLCDVCNNSKKKAKCRF